ncbi:unnamed protein product [Heligmosomoides polygyrus]|uniref:Uncharacterized protein n=1 Tax=Heligmosomoides polygyrus TaxID=6339 RepID=A0A183F3G8_HELPZ|nr:unnamed protein product [Heligmosomoides polygyrus]
MDPPRSRDTKSVILVVQGFHEEVRPTRWWASWCSLDIPRNPVGDCSRPAGVCEAHYVAGPPNFRQLGPRDSVFDLRASAKLGTPEFFTVLLAVVFQLEFGIALDLKKRTILITKMIQGFL